MQVGILEAKNRFSELADLAANGEEVTVTKHGQPHIRLVAAAKRRPTREEVEELMRDIRKTREEVGLVMTLEEIKEAVAYGRR